MKDVKIEFYNNPNNTFSGTYVLEFDNVIVNNKGSYMIIETEDQHFHVFPLKTIKSYKYVS